MPLLYAEDLTSHERQATFQRKSFTHTKRKIQGIINFCLKKINVGLNIFFNILKNLV